MGPVGQQPPRVGYDGSARVYRHVHPLGVVASTVGHDSACHLLSVPSPLFPTVVHLPDADSGQEPYAAINYPYGRAV